MRLILLTFYLLTVPIVNADPSWLSSNMKKSDCDNVFWKTASMCHDEYNRQRIARIKQYFKDQIKHHDSDNCNKEKLLEEFDDRELAWEEFSARHCAFLSHCIGSCGSAHSSAYTSCMASKSGERLKLLENEIKDGIQIYGCPIKSAKNNRILSTKNYDIILTGKCELGLFFCDDVIYRGISKKNKSEITLNGKVLMKLDEKAYIDMPVGYVFKNGDIEYRVMNSGLLTAIDNKQNKVLLEEEGQWK